VELLIFIDDTNYWAMTTFLIQLKANGAVVPDQMKVQLGRIPTWYTGGRYCCGYEGNYKCMAFLYFSFTLRCVRPGAACGGGSINTFRTSGGSSTA